MSKCICEVSSCVGRYLQLVLPRKQADGLIVTYSAISLGAAPPKAKPSDPSCHLPKMDTIRPFLHSIKCICEAWSYMDGSYSLFYAERSWTDWHSYVLTSHGRRFGPPCFHMVKQVEQGLAGKWVSVLARCGAAQMGTYSLFHPGSRPMGW
jgi:hypothetical protein